MKAVSGEKSASLQHAALFSHPWIMDIWLDGELTEWGWTNLTLGLEIQPAHSQNRLEDRAMASGGWGWLSFWSRTVLALGFRRGAGVCHGHCRCATQIPWGPSAQLSVCAFSCHGCECLHLCLLENHLGW